MKNPHNIREKLAALAAREAKLEQERRAVSKLVGGVARQARIDARLTLKTVAERCEISTTQLYKLETGEAAWNLELFRRVMNANCGQSADTTADAPAKPQPYEASKPL